MSWLHLTGFSPATSMHKCGQFALALVTLGGSDLKSRPAAAVVIS